MKLNERSCCIAIAVGFSCAALVAQAQQDPPPAATIGPHLKELVGRGDTPVQFIGSVLRTGFDDSNQSDYTNYTSVAGNEFNLFSPENAMKIKPFRCDPDNLLACPSVFYTAPETLVNFANQHNAAVHGHFLIPGHATYDPQWLFDAVTDTNSGMGQRNIEIDDLVSHWAGTTHPVRLWEVVNESFDDAIPADTPTTSDWTDGLRQNQARLLNCSNSKDVKCTCHNAKDPKYGVNEDINSNYDLFLDKVGSGYIEGAFRRARADDGNAILLYNDKYFGSSNNQTSNALMMINALKSPSHSGGPVPIDAMGFQAHLSGSTSKTGAAITSTFNSFGSAGVDVYVTELDWPVEYANITNIAPGQSSYADNNQQLARQARHYHDYLEAALRSPALRGIQTWGFTDKYTYQNSTSSTFQMDGVTKCYVAPANPQPLPFDRDYNPKPAYYAMQDALLFQYRDETLQNPGFEGGSVSPWVARNSGTLAQLATPGTGHGSSNQAVKIYGRTAVNSGPSQDVTSALLASGNGAGRYYVRAWVKMQSGQPSVKVTLRLQGSRDAQPAYRSTQWFSVGTTWTQISGWIPVAWNGDLTSAILYVETRPVADAQGNVTDNGLEDYYVDDVTLSDGNLLQNAGFDSGSAPWNAYSGATLSQEGPSTDVAPTSSSAGKTTYYYGSGGAYVTNRSVSDAGAGQAITSKLLASGSGGYDFSAMVKLDESSTATRTGRVRLVIDTGTTQAPHVATYTAASTTVSGDKWTRIMGTFNVPSFTTLASAVLYIDTDSGTESYYVDEVVMRPAYTPPAVN